jgi:hypothetical protein
VPLAGHLQILTRYWEMPDGQKKEDVLKRILPDPCPVLFDSLVQEEERRTSVERSAGYGKMRISHIKKVCNHKTYCGNKQKCTKDGEQENVVVVSEAGFHCVGYFIVFFNIKILYQPEVKKLKFISDFFSRNLLAPNGMIILVKRI